MARWIALDYGMVRTGIAVTDDAAIIASPLETVATAELLGRLNALIAERPCAGIVVGDPGQITDSTEGIAALLSDLHRTHPAKSSRPSPSMKTAFAIQMGPHPLSLGPKNDRFP